MKIIIFGLILIFLAYELFIKDAFGFKRVFVNHLIGFDHKIYGALISVVIPFLLLLLFRETHVHTARNLENVRV